ncbi:MAG: site-specific integrase [Deltaproteobacteria bacterium]|nr:site-specific integrase [Deltaproteobacteria bacterium]
MARIKDYLNDFTRYLSIEKNASIRTKDSYLIDINQLGAFLKKQQLCISDDEVNVKLIDEYVLRGFISSLYKKIKKISIARKISSLKVFFNFLVKRGVLAENPALLISLPKTEKFLPTVLSREEAGELVAVPFNAWINMGLYF